MAATAVEAELPAHALAVDRQRGAGQGGGAERQHVDAPAAVGQSVAVALVLLDVGQEVVRRQHRLGALQVRVAGQDQVAVALGRGQQGALQFLQPAVEVVDGVAHPELHVGDDLIVAAAAGVQLAAEVAETLDQGALDVRVDVFQGDREGELAAVDLAGDGVEGGGDLLGLVGAEQADLGEHPGVGLAGADVVAVEAAVEADRFGEGFDAVVGGAAEAAAPGLLAHGGGLEQLRGRWRRIVSLSDNSPSGR